ncbi:heterokaryon incompatibility protein-domain-containing protein [Daldinia vernicosa]|uniref:heterokaryon incompatibility protein-domain-containing protein n=1 Tax=Daldinia vernicosa TaxID=114800 RepID=UPI00200803C1|nr:heterokaryon incompatibility protein-domain-containing protein [Daldinia vernicosa]KAI0850529.1 heterokaryon incompatibility protein-domain-containing protein [Daldinia vernicosa]
MSGNSRHYSSLDHSRREIRLLHLHPGKLSSLISCHLSQCSLDDKPTYEALSYVWGTSINPQRIVLTRDNLFPLEGSDFAVAPNLYAALQFIRKPDAERIVWIDAICINQEDIPEREYQVALMGQIYSGAKQVLCWLGTPNDNGIVNPQGSIISADEMDDMTSLKSRFGGPNSPEVQNTKVAIRFLRTLANLGEENHLKDSPLFERVINTRRPPNEAEFTVASSYIEGFKVLVRWINSAWWDRAWTVQEARLAQDLRIVIYHVMIPFKTLLLAQHFLGLHMENCCGNEMDRLLKDQRNVLKKFLAKTVEIIPQLIAQDSPRDLGYLLRRYRVRQATDSLDKVYSLLGLSVWNHAAPLKPNYSISPEQLYVNTTMKLIEDSNSLNILQGAQSSLKRLRLPSWVHDWTIPMDGEDGFRELERDQGLYNAGGQLSKVRLCCNSELIVDGLMVGVVTSVGDICDIVKGTTFEDLIGWERLIYKHGLHPDEPYTNGQSYSDAFRSTLGGDVVCTTERILLGPGIPMRNYFRSGYKGPERRQLDESDEDLCRNWWEIVVHADESDTAPPSWYNHAASVIIPTVGNNRFYITNQGLMGIGPPGMVTGDTVFVLRGSALPYILRQVGSSHEPKPKDCHAPAEHRLKLVGSSYVHGIMDGEVLKDDTKTRVEIHLC